MESLLFSWSEASMAYTLSGPVVHPLFPSFPKNMACSVNLVIWRQTKLSGMFRRSASLAIPHLKSFAAIPSVSLALLGHTNRNVFLSHELICSVKLRSLRHFQDQFLTKRGRVPQWWCTFFFLVGARVKQTYFLGACAMTTKFLDNKKFTFKILLSWRFPWKIAFWTIFLPALLPTPAWKVQTLFFKLSSRFLWL